MLVLGLAYEFFLDVLDTSDKNSRLHFCDGVC